MSTSNRKIGKKTARSQFEKTVWEQINNVLPKRATVGYEVDKLPYVTEQVYNPDFTITLKDGTIIFIEAKGLGRAFDGTARAKMVAVKHCHPDKDIRIVFMSDRPFRKGGKMKPSEWATKYGFPFAIGEVPEDWFT